MDVELAGARAVGLPGLALEAEAERALEERRPAPAPSRLPSSFTATVSSNEADFAPFSASWLAFRRSVALMSPDEEPPEAPPDPLDPPPHAAATRRVTSSSARRRFIGAVPFMAVLAA